MFSKVVQMILEKLWSKPEHAHLLVLSAAPLRVSMSCQVAIVIIPYYTIVGHTDTIPLPLWAIPYHTIVRPYRYHTKPMWSHTRAILADALALESSQDS